MAQRLQSLTLKGYRTIRELVGFEPGALTVLIGPNGAGKSNFISFFRLLSHMVDSPGTLQEYVARQGGASAILHDGPEKTREVEVALQIGTDTGQDDYEFRLAYAAGDTLVISDEKYRFTPQGQPPGDWRGGAAGHREAHLLARELENDAAAKTICVLLRRIFLHQFHNTSLTARMRGKWDVADGRWLKEDAGNLAAFLYRLRNEEPAYYGRILGTIRLIVPFFMDFDLHPEYGRLLLRWKERGVDRTFDASQAADGMLRAMALVTLLLQPEKDLPDILVIDEPELGLHPYAINVIGGLIRATSQRVQVIVATQSVSLIDCFEPEDIVVVDRKERTRESRFRRLDSMRLASWLEDYSISELWEKNVVGGRPG